MKKRGKKLFSVLLTASLLLSPGTLTAWAGEGKTELGGTVTDTNTQHTQDRYAELSAQSVSSAKLTAWKNDKAVSELVLYAKNGSLKNVAITAGDLTGSRGVIDAGNVTATFIKSTLAYNRGYVYGSEPPAATADNRSEASDILYQTEPVDIPSGSLQPVWVEFAIPGETEAGTYTGTLTVTADNADAPLIFTYQICVQDAALPDAESFGDTFDIELWQYPYTSAEYYGVEPFSPEHFAVMESSMVKYREIGGHAITASIVEEAWEGQTYSKNEIHYPSMVKWTKEADGSFSYDYTDFDKWIEFNKSLGIGDKIVLYSIAPWHNCITYWENDKLVYETFTPGSSRYTQVWTDFLTNLSAHLEEKGWFEDAYIGIDERGFSSAAFDLVDSITNSRGESLKTAGAMDSFVEKKELALRVTDLNVGDTAAAAHPADFEKLVAERTARGFRTTLYSCTGHMPGNFALNQPVESYWSIVNAGKSGTAGFLRWAYDAWVENPLEDVTHSKYEAGDCFLIYPDKKDAENPVSKSSVRLEKMAEGVRDVNKLLLMEKENPSMSEKIRELYAGISTTAQSRPSAENAYLGDGAVTQLIREMDAFQEGVAELTYQYIAERDGLTDGIEAVSIAEGAGIELETGSLTQLHAVFVPENVISTEVFWTSSDDGVASVDARGKVTAGREGKAVITAVSVWDSSKKASIAVTVSPKKPDESGKPGEIEKQDDTPGKMPDTEGAGQETEQPGAVVTAPDVKPEVSAPAKVRLSSAKRISTGKIKLKWKKVSGASGYEIYRSVKKKGKYTRIAVIKKGKTVTYTDKKAKRKRTYYYKVRAYRTVDGKTMRGSFSNVKKGGNLKK